MSHHPSSSGDDPDPRRDHRQPPQSQPQSQRDGHAYDDPSNLLNVYPFMSYTPTARVAQHLSPHTVTHLPSPSSADLFPQYQEILQRLDHPTNVEEWAMRQAAEARLREALARNGSSYAQRPSPATPHCFQSGPYTPDSWDQNVNGGPQQSLPLPYNFLPSYLPSSSTSSTAGQRNGHNHHHHQHAGPPTPNSITGSESPSASEHFESFVTHTLSRAQPIVSTPAPTQPPSKSASQSLTAERVRAVSPKRPSMTDMRNPHPPSSVTSTPTHERIAPTPSESPDPLSLPGPSPTKRRRGSSNSLREESPTLASLKNLPANGEIGLSSLSMKEETSAGSSGGGIGGSVRTPKITLKLPKQVIEVQIPTRKRPSDEKMRSSHVQRNEGDVNEGEEEEEEEEEEEDRLDWGNEDEDWNMADGYASPDTERKPTVPQGSGRTGERDMRTSWQKLHTLLEDIIEESDAFPTNPTSGDLAGSRFFSSTTHDGSTPLLSVKTIYKISQYVSRVQSSRRRQKSLASTTGENGEWDSDVISGIFRLLERSMRDAEHVIVFAEDRKAVAASSQIDDGKDKAKKKKWKPANREAAKPPSPSKEGLETELRDEVLEASERGLSRVRSGVAAAECCLILLGSDGLTKQMYSEDLLSTCVTTVKGQMEKVIFPIVEGLAGEKMSSTYLAYVVEFESRSTSKKDRLPKSVAPYFVNPTLSAIAQSISCALPRLTSLISKPDLAFSDSLVIQTVYLAIGPLFINEPTAKKVTGRQAGAGKEGMSVMKSLRMESLGCLRGAFARYEEQRQWIIEEILSSLVRVPEQIHAQTRYQLANGKSIHTISALLLQLIQASAFGVVARVKKLHSTAADAEVMGTPASKVDLQEEEARLCADTIESALRSTTTKATKTSHDADYKAILDLFIADLLAVLYRPEWPAASLYLSVISKLMIASLEDGRPGPEMVAAKGIALDYLGDIAARLKALHLDMMGPIRVPTIDEAQASVQMFLSSAARDDGSFSLVSEKDGEAQDISQRLQNIATTLKNTLRNVWMGDEGLFEITDPKQGEAAAQASTAVSRGRSLQSAVDPILHAILGVLDNSAVGLRSKALRAVGTVVMVDPEVLGLHQIRQALEDRLSDGSPAVRDAAVELVGKYLVQKPKLAAEYYPHIAQRVLDPGLGVRKRVIKLLRASKSLTDMLYPSQNGDTAGLLVDILSDFSGANVVLERAMDGVSKDCEATGRKERFGQTIDALISRMIDATEEAEFDSLSHIRAIWLLCASDPSQIDTHKAGVLLSYLRPPANSDDQATNELLLRIFRKCIPCMPRTASTFAQDLTKALMPMISKPTGGFQALRETIGCFCAVTNYLTKDWARLITVLRACEAKIRPIHNRFVSTGTASTLNQATAMMLYITALILEGCRLDAIAQDDDIVELELRKISHLPVAEYLFEVYLGFARMPTSQTAPIICLGSLFRTYPWLLQRPETTEWMQTTFNSSDTDNQARLLGVIHEFLAAEVEKRASGEMLKRDVSLLIGNAKELQDSDYSTTIVQNNIEQIFECARSQHPPTQNAALDVLTFVVNQGLYSPTVPILVTLETSEDPAVAERALALHVALHSKHSSLVTVLFLESAKASYDFQRDISAEPSGQRSGEALLQSWYSLLSEKRVWRHDFLKALCRAFDRDLDSEVDIGFILYLAENLATLEYKLQEEPMTVVQALSRVVSTCTHLATIMEEVTIDAPGGDQDLIDGLTVDLGKAGAGAEGKMDVKSLVDGTIVVGLAVLVKNHLLGLYHLPEDKCASHVPGKKSAGGEKPAQRRGPCVLDVGRMPLVRGVRTVGEFKEQQATFLRVLHQDGSLSDDGH
ncbi:hypothetical protein IAR55_006651 [Kwoniella newhampshirensis]|uniref:Sister chromatid cohesion protein n=1 Tax=Kwoniella newhampshirensis TaxID=1651941 RepID=A0AAW0YUA8_9TREE